MCYKLNICQKSHKARFEYHTQYTKTQFLMKEDQFHDQFAQHNKRNEEKNQLYQL